MKEQTSALLQNVEIILVEPSHMGNIGSACRAMKTMGLHRLCVVTSDPIETEQSVALAKGAVDVLQQARVVSSLDEALADKNLVLGTSARTRSVELPLLQPREAASRVIAQAQTGQQCAIVFGRERTGLTNEELIRCDLHVNIDANEEYSSLNLAMSVQVISYELRQTLLRSEETAPLAVEEKPTHQQLEAYYRFLEEKLIACGFLKEKHQGAVMAQLRRIYAKADLSNHELQIVYGVMASLLKHHSAH